MKTVSLRELQREFESRLLGTLPGFRRLNVELPSGFLAYSWEVDRPFTVFVVLCPVRHEQRFSVQTGWSERGEFPNKVRQIAGHLFPDPGGRWPAHEPLDGGLIFFLVDFKRLGTAALVWDVQEGRRFNPGNLSVSNTTRQSRVVECVHDAIDVLQTEALPYIEKRTGRSFVENLGRM